MATTSEQAIAQAQAAALTQHYRAMSEAEWARIVDETLERGGWDWITLVDSRRQHAVGWPDRCAFHPTSGRVVAIELKTERGRTTAEQRRWLALMDRCGIETYVLRPSDTDRMRAILLEGASGCAA